MHIYRDSPTKMNVLPAIPTRTSSLNPDLKEKSRRSPADIFERYMKSVYHPLDTAPPPVNTDLRHSFRGPTGHRSRATVINTTNPPVNADQREARASSTSPPMYKIRARSNSFKENDKGGWITVGPEFSIKPAGGVQPVINVTILPTMKTAEMEYSGMVVPERIVSGTGGVNVQSMGSGHGKPPVLNIGNATVSASSNHHPAERDGLYQIYTPLPPPAAVPPHAALPPTPAEKEKPRLTSLLRRRNSSMSRAHTPQLTGQPFQRTYSMNLKSALKKRSSSQSYFEPKKSVTFADYTTVYS